jgi:hypothetical protein
MGEVYRGVDTRLGRSVAIKILPRQRAEREDARARFGREAKAVSQLNHPHICTLHDVGEASVDGTAVHYLVMELLDGETLADRISRGAIPVDQAVKLAMEIAEALDCAHRHGIVHRDLKPANIMITTSGVKLLDFGLAKTLQHASSDSAAATVQGATAEGVIVGTLQYMAPEQLTGGVVDARSDMFAFGAVMFEMLTGRRAFEGATQASLIAGIIHSDPPRVSQLRAVAPASLDRIIAMCLNKDPEERWQNARDVALQLRTIDDAPDAATPRRRWLTFALAAAVSAGALLGAGAAYVALRTPAQAPSHPRQVSVDIAPALPLMPNGFGAPFDIAPDASKVVWVGGDARCVVPSALRLARGAPHPGNRRRERAFFFRLTATPSASSRRAICALRRFAAMRRCAISRMPVPATAERGSTISRSSLRRFRAPV